MVTVAQLVEPRTVTPVVAGSNPVSHPIFQLPGFLRLQLDYMLQWHWTEIIWLELLKKH